MHYLFAALLAIDGLGWLAHLPADHDPRQLGLRATLDALHGADSQYLSGTPFDVDAAWPYVTLWCLRLNRFLHPVDGLDQALYDWRTRSEDHAGERFHWLPSFPEHTP